MAMYTYYLKPPCIEFPVDMIFIFSFITDILTAASPLIVKTIYY